MVQASFVRHVADTHCFTCNKQTAKFACGACGVGTYCNKECARKGWHEHGHRETCAHYSRLVGLASGMAMAGFAHLDTPEERAGFEHFRAETNGAEDDGPLTDADELLDAIWDALSNTMRDAWDKKAIRRGIGSGRAAFDEERRPVVMKDLKEVYPADTRNKQIWRNLVKSERTVHMTHATSTPLTKKRAASAVSEKDVEERAAKRREIVRDVLDDYLSTIPTELVVAILNDLPRESILAVAGTNKRLNAIAWKVFFAVDMEEHLQKTAEGRALRAELYAAAKVSSGETDYKRMYEAAYDHFARKARPLATLMVTDAYAPQPRPDKDIRRFLLVGNGDMSAPILIGRDAYTYDVVDEDSDIASVNEHESLVFLEEELPKIVGTGAQQRAVEKYLTEVFSDWVRRREVVQNWLDSSKVSDMIRRLFGNEIVIDDGVSVRPSSPLIHTDAKLQRSYLAMRDTLRAYRFSLLSRPDEAACIEAVTAFLVDLMIRHDMQLTLYVGSFEDAYYWSEDGLAEWEGSPDEPYFSMTTLSTDGEYTHADRALPIDFGAHGLKLLTEQQRSDRDYWDTASLLSPDEERDH